MIPKDIAIPEIPRLRIETILEILAILGVVLSPTIVGINWSDLPNRVPSHFGISGSADGWSGRSSLLILPVLILIIYAVLSFIIRYPLSFNYPWAITTDNVISQVRIARITIRILKTEVIWLFLVIDYMTIQTAKGNIDGLGVAFLPIVMVIIIGTIGYQLFQAYKAR